MSLPRCAAVLLCLVAGCGGPRPADPDAGRSQAYRAGEPDFDLEAVSSVRDDGTGIDIALSLPHASLIYRRDGDAYAARVRWTLVLRAPSGATQESLSWEETVRLTTLAATRTFEPVVRTRRVVLPAGVVAVFASVEDLGTAREATRTVTVSIEQSEAAPALAGLRLFTVRDTSAVPLVAASAVVAGDSLRATAQATGLPDGSLATARVLQYRVDTTAAESPGGFSPMLSSLAALGVDLASPDTVFAETQVLDFPAEAVQIEAPLPPLVVGTYRIEMEVRPAGSEPIAARVGRVLTTRRGDFPALVRIGDLIEPLVYIATPREVDAMRTARGAFAQRAAFDRFWGTLIPDRRVAAATLRTFYERAEEANRLYSTHKAGWKTDRGMISVVFGPPEFVDRRLNEETWVFGSGSLLPSVTFDRTASRELDGVPFDVFTLRRNVAYDRAWRAALRRWRSGEVPG